MRKRHQKSPTRNIVRYLRQETWMKKRVGALRDRLLRRRKNEKKPVVHRREKLVINKNEKISTKKK